MTVLNRNHGPIQWTSLFRERWIPNLISGDQLVGLDIGSQAVKLVKMTITARGWQLQQFRVKFLSPTIGQTNVFDQDDQLLTVLKDLFMESGLRERRVATSIAGPSVIIKSLELPTMTKSELEEHLDWEIDRYIPYDIQDIYWDYHLPNSVMTRSSSKMNVHLVAARKETVDRRIELLKRAEVEPLVMDVDNFALTNMYTMNYGEQDKVLLAHVGPSGVNMTIMNAEGTKHVRDTPIDLDWYRCGISRLCQAQNEGHGMNKSFVDEQGIQSSVLLEEVYQEIAEEIRRTLDNYQANEPDQEVHQIVLSGGYATLPNLIEYLRDQITVSVEMMNPFKEIDISTLQGKQNWLKESAPLAAVAVGLALRKSGDR